MGGGEQSSVLLAISSKLKRAESERADTQAQLNLALAALKGEALLREGDRGRVDAGRATWQATPPRSSRRSLGLVHRARARASPIPSPNSSPASARVRVSRHGSIFISPALEQPRMEPRSSADIGLFRGYNPMQSVGRTSK